MSEPRTVHCPKCGQDWSRLAVIRNAKRQARADALRDAAAAVEELPKHPYYGGDEADGMCPNCLTPWKCNGPHVPRDRDPAGYEVDRAAAIKAIRALGERP